MPFVIISEEIYGKMRDGKKFGKLQSSTEAGVDDRISGYTGKKLLYALNGGEVLIVHPVEGGVRVSFGIENLKWAEQTFSAKK